MFFYFLSAVFLLGLFVRLFWEGSGAIALEEFYLPTLGQTLALTRGQFSFGEIVWLLPTLKLTLILIQTPTPNRWVTFLGKGGGGAIVRVFKCNKSSTSL